MPLRKLSKHVMVQFSRKKNHDPTIGINGLKSFKKHFWYRLRGTFLKIELIKFRRMVVYCRIQKGFKIKKKNFQFWRIKFRKFLVIFYENIIFKLYDLTFTPKNFECIGPCSISNWKIHSIKKGPPRKYVTLFSRVSPFCFSQLLIIIWKYNSFSAP